MILSKEISDIKNCYNCWFHNGNMELELLFYTVIDCDDYAVFKRSENDFIVAHNLNIDTKMFIVSWCYGHYDFTSFEEAKKYIEENPYN